MCDDMTKHFSLGRQMYVYVCIVFGDAEQEHHFAGYGKGHTDEQLQTRKGLMPHLYPKAFLRTSALKIAT